MNEETDTMLWGSWEELVLGGAVLRHGTRSWDAVAAELRSRTFYPYCFTPEVCKTKYQDLQNRYSGGTSAWFEELKKQRVAELKRELEKSDGSIGSLESKLESLKSQKQEDHNGNYISGHTESPPSVGNLARVNYPSKETSKDGLSAGSFTEETQTDSSPECRIPAVTATEIKTEEGENATSKEVIVKKRRGKRKRKDCSKDVIIEVNMRDNKDESTGAVRSCNDVDQNDQTVEEEKVDLMSVLNSIVESENLAVFHRRTDSQRRGKYKKTIRRHMDLSIIRSGISDGSIQFAKELYLDLLLLCNNALVFYSKESREHKAAHSLRVSITKTFRHNLNDYGMGTSCSSVLSPEKPACNTPVKPTVLPLEKAACNPPVKPRSVRPGNPKVAGKFAAQASPLEESKKTCNAEVPVELKEGVVAKSAKKKADQPVKVGRSGGSKRVETPVNGRKKARKR